MIAFVVLGIVASMTIPIVVKQQKYRENIAGYHRAVNALNKAFNAYYDSQSTVYTIGSGTLNSTSGLMTNLITAFLPLVSKTTTTTMAGCSSSAQLFYTADSMRYCIEYSASTSVNSIYGEKTYGIVWVDVNGDKKPNAIPESIKNPGDTFPIVILKNRFIPGHTNSANATLAQKIYYGEK